MKRIEPAKARLHLYQLQLYEALVERTSWFTGLTRLLPESYTERTGESNTWTSYKKVPLNHFSEIKYDIVQKAQQGIEMEADVGKKVEAANGDDNYTLPTIPTFNILNDDVFKNGLQHQSEDPKSRKLFLMRHGERVDFTFGVWIPYCFDENGKYIRKDLNMPESVPERPQGPSAFINDCPLTKVGIFQARTAGEALKEVNLDVSHVYCSPSLRSIQTCDAFLQGCNKKEEIKIKIEPGLFEWLLWYPNGTPGWMSPGELVAAGYNIDQEYQPFFTESKLKQSTETCEQYYSRNASVARGALNAHPDGNVLLVGHSSTLEVCSRELIGEKPRSANEMTKIIQKVPYCGLLQLTQKSDKWEITGLPFPSMTHTTNHRFDFKILMN